ncbi:MAG: hypothetical protein EOM12_15830 [Verrucomicrobiae bacterium]|nr:hypothetical protein [Verrucomicrobiae bacterium]
MQNKLTSREVSMLRVLAVFMIFVAVVMLSTAVKNIIKFHSPPNSEIELLRYMNSVIDNGNSICSDSDILAEQLHEIGYYYLAVLRVALKSLLGSGICLIITSCGLFYITFAVQIDAVGHSQTPV